MRDLDKVCSIIFCLLPNDSDDLARLRTVLLHDSFTKIFPTIFFNGEQKLLDEHL